MLTTSENPKTVDDEKTGADKTEPTCVACQKSSFKKLLNSYDFDTGKEYFTLESCNNCQLTRTAPVLSDSELSRYYETSYYGSSAEKFNPLIESWTIRSNNRLASNILASFKQSSSVDKKNITVLDIGCGRANLLKAFARQGCECYGVERSDFPSDSDMNNINIFKQDLCEAPFKENSFDIIVIWHVLEHLTNPAKTLEIIQHILKPDGLLVIAVPNFGSLQSKLFGKHWFHLDLPRHTYHFTRRSLKKMMHDIGLSIQSTSTNSLDQSVFGFIQSAANTLFPATPNAFYALLKTAQKRPNITRVLLQFLIAGVLLPFAILEYFLSWAIGAGACLIITANKKQSN